MTTEIDFLLNANKKISIEVPDVLDKFTCFYESTEKLHKFDVITVYFIDNDKKVIIYQDMLDDFILPFHILLLRALNNILSLPKEITVGNALLTLNDNLNERTSIEMNPYWLASTVKDKTDTLLYTVNNNIYLEVGIVYPWTFLEPKPGDRYVTYDEFIKNYKPLLVELIPHEIAKQWLTKSEEILKSVEIDYQTFVQNALNK